MGIVNDPDRIETRTCIEHITTRMGFLRCEEKRNHTGPHRAAIANTPKGEPVALVWGDPAGKVCVTCKRPWKRLQPHERARTGDHPGVERDAADAATEREMSRACQVVLAELKRASAASAGWQGWVSAIQLRALLDGGDGPRRVRQLRDEWAWPIETKMSSTPKRQAWYRLTADRPLTGIADELTAEAQRLGLYDEDLTSTNQQRRAK